MKVSKKELLARLKVSPTLDGNLIVLEDITYKNVTVPKGFPFNGANVPRMLWIFVSPFKPVNLVPVVFHDYLCSIKDYDLADEYFDELLDLVDEEVFKDVMVKAVDLYNKLIRNHTNAK